jgi:DNA-binding SARP family transcriptional activator
VNFALAARVSLLNGFALELGRPKTLMAINDLPRSVQRLVALLSLSDCPCRTTIAGQLWPDVPEDHAQGSLRSGLWRLQKTVPGLVDSSGGGLRLAKGVRVDVRELEDWSLRVLDPHDNGDDVVLPATALHGELLPGWYDDWVLLERERLRQLRMHALEMLAGRLVHVGRYGEAVQVAHGAVVADPLRESAHRVLVRVYLAEGNVVEAMRAYDYFRKMLADELGVAPTALMEELMRQVGGS